LPRSGISSSFLRLIGLRNRAAGGALVAKERPVEPVGVKFCFAQPERVTTRDARSLLLSRHRREPRITSAASGLAIKAANRAMPGLARTNICTPHASDDVGLALLALRTRKRTRHRRHRNAAGADTVAVMS
jgi:hypothetical protein